MPEGDTFPLGEERRLFYVALTRARRSVAMFTVRGQCSTFLRELEDDRAVVITDTDGQAIKEASCPACKQGVLVLRTGPYGEFRSCSNFPACNYKPKARGEEVPSVAKQHTTTSMPARPRNGSRSTASAAPNPANPPRLSSTRKNSKSPRGRP